MKLGLVIYSDDAETVWNAFRLAVHARKQGDAVKVFLLAKGVTAEGIGNDQFPVSAVMQDFVARGGEMLACGTCLKLRQQGSSDVCPASTMGDLYAMVNDSDKVLTF
jgi:uncharacterized protein involved in oxidation of intracellular sulfur